MNEPVAEIVPNTQPQFSNALNRRHFFYFDDSAVLRVARPEVALNCAEPMSCQRLPSPGVVDREFESQVGLTHVTSATQRDAEPDFRLAGAAGPPRPVRRGD